MRLSTPQRAGRMVFSSMSDEWRTPEALYAELDREFAFDFDPCPMTDGLKADGLLADWGRSTFCNPPYSDLKSWMAKGVAEWQKGKTVVFLVPSRTDTAWWHDYAMQANEIRFIRKRLTFGGREGHKQAPFPSAVVVFRG